MRVKIVSNGSPYETHVINAETGEEIKPVYRIEWVIDANNPKPAQIILHVRADLEIEGEAEIVRIPRGDQP